MSTNSDNSDSIDENAIEMTKLVVALELPQPRASFVQGFNWSEQLKSRAETTITGDVRLSFSFASGSPPRNGALNHGRTKSISDLSQPPTQAPVAEPPQERQKPDAFQERILKGDFYMD
ncbi:hypothetical protein DL771_002036 [Monosporascus sp. 5C6A]|nr:hypothetical protein DL771_002036 [Monosporascus sp. 5C6A]